MRNSTFVSNNHCVFNLTYHVIFVTKFRNKCLTKEILQDLYYYLPSYSKKIGLSIKEIKGESDHVHFLLEAKPTDKLSDVIGCLKSKSTSFLYFKKHKFPYWGKLSRTIRSSGYFICSAGGVTIDVLERYIKNQEP